MKRTLALLLTVALLLITVHRSPAPISEESPTPTEQSAAKHKSTESSEFNSARRFDGTWKGTSSKKQTIASGSEKGDYVYSYSYTLSIKDGKTANLISEGGITLPRGKPIYFKVTNHSDNLAAAGSSDLIIRWAGGRVIDWEPKTLTTEQVQFHTESETKKGGASLFSLKGDVLVSGGGIVYHRVK
jgi:hypothetical protein